MKRPTKWERLRGIAQELGTIARRGAPGLAAGSLAASAGARRGAGGHEPGQRRQHGDPAVPGPADRCGRPRDPPRQHGRRPHRASPRSIWPLIGGAYLVRECMNVLRRFLVERTCTRIDKDMYVRVVAHLMKVDLTVLAQDQVGALYGRINRSVEGLVRFLRLTFLDFVPALFTGSFALVAAFSQAAEDRPGDARRGAGLAGLTIWQLITQKGIRLDLLRPARRWTARSSSSSAGSTTSGPRTPTGRRSGGWSGRPSGGGPRSCGTTSRCRSSAPARRSTRGSSTSLVLAFAVYLFVHGRIRAGEILIVLGAVPQRDGPAERDPSLHRRGAREQPEGRRPARAPDGADRPLVPDAGRRGRAAARRGRAAVRRRRAWRSSSAPPAARRERGARRPVGRDPARRDDRRGGPIGLRQDDLAPHPDAAGASLRRHATLGGVPLERVTRKAIGELVGYVGQNPFVFAGTIAENIAYGCDGATDEQIRRAAEMACIHDEIMVMPGGYRARVAERGQNLSGGQRQRIALARVFLKNPPILILDEGTSRPGQHQRAAGPAGDQRRPGRPHGHPRRPPPDHPARRRSHPRLRRRPDRRDRHLCRAGPPRRRLRRAGPFGRGHEPPADRIDVPVEGSAVALGPYPSGHRRPIRSASAPDAVVAPAATRRADPSERPARRAVREDDR